MQKIYKKKIININPPSLIKLIKEKVKKRKRKNYTVLTVGRLVEEKGIDTMIKAFKEIKLQNVIFQVVGDGKERKNLESLTYVKIGKFGILREGIIGGTIGFIGGAVGVALGVLRVPALVYIL